ncbi:MAG: DUF58 domain-containing protein [Gemmatimonadota bacterium]|jgi:uncharacterized protein (DUF58 family)
MTRSDPLRAVTRLPGTLRRGWRRLRAWRRIRFTPAGVVFTVGAVAVGFAAVNTGNNLLYLLLGAMLGLVLLSGWLSEQVIRKVEVERRVPHGTPVGRDVRILYEVRNRKARLPTLTLEIVERGLPGSAFVGWVKAGGSASAKSVNRFVRRGVYPLEAVTLSTTFPFGLFVKERDIELPGELVIWPGSDRALRAPRTGGGQASPRGPASVGAAGHRGEYRNLREYRPGDDPRDIHWRRSAGRRAPVVREYEADAARAFWLCLDTGDEPGPEAEERVEVAASLAAGAVRAGRRFGVVAGQRTLEPGSGPGHLEAVLDALARVDFHPSDPVPRPPVDATRCVLVARTGRGGSRWGDRFTRAEGDT